MIGAVASNATTNIVIQAASLVTGVLLARTLGPEGRGDLAVVLLWPSLLAGMGALGLDVVLARGAAGHQSRAALNRKAIVLAGLLGIALVGFGACLLPHTLEEKKYLLGIARFALLAVPTSLMTVFLFSIALGSRDYWIYNSSRLAFSLFYIACLLLVWMAGRLTVRVVAAAFVGASAAAASYSVASARWNGPMRDGKSYMGMIIHALPFGGSSALSAVHTQLGVLLGSFFLPAEEIGLYVVALVAASAHSVLGNALAKTAFAEIAATRERTQNRLLASYIRNSLAFYSIVTLGTIAVIPFFVPVVFGASFLPARPLTAALIPATTLSALGLICDESLKGLGNARTGIAAKSLAITITTSLSFALIPRFGVMGLILSITAGIGAQVLFLFVSIQRTYDLQWESIVRIRLRDYETILSVARRLGR